MLDKTMEVAPHKEVSPRMAEPEKKPSSHRGLWLLLVLALIGGGIFAWRSMQKPQANAAAVARDNNARLGTPVVASLVKRQDMPVFLDGLGSVTAFYTDTVKSRVDGELTEIHFAEGQEVHKGDLLAVIDPRPYQVALDQAMANLARDQAQLADAKLDAGRYNELVKSGVIAQQQYDTQAALAGQLTGSVAADQAAIESAKLNIVYSHITSPIDGRVGLRLVDPGNIVHATDTNGLLVITQMQPIAVIFTLPEDSLPAVNSHMRGGAHLQVKALSRDDGTELATGTLVTIDNQIDQTTGTYRLKAVFSNENRALWPNQFVNARLLLDTKKDAVIIPAAATQRGSQGTFVYVVKPDKTVEVRPVTVGFTEGTLSSIDKGLAPNEVVVTDGQDRLRAGLRVDAHVDDAGGNPAGAQDSTSSGDPKPRQFQKRAAGQDADAAPGNGSASRSYGGQGGQGYGNGQQGGQGDGKKKYRKDGGAPNPQ
jgi:membrane fusion protein, multidrug efflux system